MRLVDIFYSFILMEKRNAANAYDFEEITLIFWKILLELKKYVFSLS